MVFSFSIFLKLAWPDRVLIWISKLYKRKFEFHFLIRDSWEKKQLFWFKCFFKLLDLIQPFLGPGLWIHIQLMRIQIRIRQCPLTFLCIGEEKKTKFKHFWYLERKKMGIRIRIFKLYKRRFEFHFLICVLEKNGCYGLSNKKKLVWPIRPFLGLGLWIRIHLMRIRIPIRQCSLTFFVFIWHVLPLLGREKWKCRSVWIRIRFQKLRGTKKTFFWLDSNFSGNWLGEK